MDLIVVIVRSVLLIRSCMLLGLKVRSLKQTRSEERVVLLRKLVTIDQWPRRFARHKTGYCTRWVFRDGSLSPRRPEIR